MTQDEIYYQFNMNFYYTNEEEFELDTVPDELTLEEYIYSLLDDITITSLTMLFYRVNLPTNYIISESLLDKLEMNKIKYNKLRLERINSFVGELKV